MKHPCQASFVTTLLVFCGACFGQPGADSLHLKYNHYREMLKNKYVLIGEGPGKSQPAQKRTDESYLEWSDATIDLGWYIAVLATEHGMLAKQNLRTDSTDRELYYALMAFNRLDDHAENYFERSLKGIKPVPGDGEVERNGFFVRDDVTDDFVRNNNDHFQLRNIRMNDPADPGFEKGISEGYGPREMSFDQVVHLMMGFALVAKLVDTSVVYNGTGLVKETRAIVDRIMSHVRHGIWNIKNPVTGKVVMGVCYAQKPYGIKFRKADLGGALADCMSYGMVVAASKIYYGFEKGIRQAEPFRNGASRINKPFFRTSRIYNKNILFLHLAAVGDSWGRKTQRKLCKVGMEERREHLPLLHAAIYGPRTKKGIPQVSKACFDEVQKMMMLAPWEGPNVEAADLGWTGNNRFRDYPKGNPHNYKGICYNGLDYMLIHNLYFLLSPASN